MSTRATYTINGHHFYVHHDGYPEGAADKFKDMLDACADQAAPNGTIQDAFMRGNPNAELIRDPEEYGDTEFHYTLSGGSREDTDPGRITCYAIDLNRWSDDGRAFIFSGSLKKFIETNQN